MWMNPRTWVSGELVTAQLLNEQLRDNLLALYTAPAVPAGIVHQFAGAVAPTGYLLCDGAAVSRTTYATLFAAISTAYGGGDGTSTFNLPDMRGRTPVGKGTHVDVDALGESDGVALASRRPKHAHTVTDPGHSHGPGGGALDYWGGKASGPTVAGGGNYGIQNMSATAAAATGISVGTSGVTDSPAFLVVNFIIKT